MNIVEIVNESFTTNEQGVKDFHLLSGYKEDFVLDYKFDAISDPLVFLSHLGVNLYLYEVKNDLFVTTPVGRT